jgi:predicted ATPase
MKVKSVYLENVRGLPTIDLGFFDSVIGQIRSRTVIAGSNGSGKTTTLDAIYTLMNLIVSKPDKSLTTWLIPGQVRARLELDDMPTLSHPDPHHIFPSGWSLVVALGPELWLSKIKAPHLIALTGNTVANWHYVRNDQPGTFLLAWPVKREWMESERPTTLYFPSEQRELVAKRKGQIIAETFQHEWVWRFSDSQKWEGSLESFIVALYARETFEQLETSQEEEKTYPTFQEFLDVVNSFLARKRITGVSSANFRVQVEGEDGQKFSLDELSSGEKQVLLILAEIQRRIRRNSVLLIDEPEIHLHPAWQARLMGALTDMCRQYDTQMIITTHSEEIARSVYEHELVLLDDVFGWRKGK